MKKFSNIMSTVIIIIIIVIFIYFLIDLIRRKLIYHPVEYQPEKYDNFRKKLIQLTGSSSNVNNFFVGNIDCWHIKNPHVKSTIMFAHGNGGNVTHRYEIISFLYTFASVIIFDYRGYGKSCEKVMSCCSLGEDAELIWNYMISELKLKPEDIVLMGESLGCSVVLQTAVNHKTKGVILNSPFYSMNEMAGSLAKQMGASYSLGKLLNIFHSLEYANNKLIIKSQSPIIIAHSKTDELVPYEQAEKLFELIKDKPNCRLVQIQGSHNNLILNDEYIYSITSLLQ